MIAMVAPSRYQMGGRLAGQPPRVNTRDAETSRTSERGWSLGTTAEQGQASALTMRAARLDERRVFRDARSYRALRAPARAATPAIAGVRHGMRRNRDLLRARPDRPRALRGARSSRRIPARARRCP